jgi:hypothetical protein
MHATKNDKEKDKSWLQVQTNRSVGARNRIGWNEPEEPTDLLEQIPIGWEVAVFTRLHLLTFLLLIIMDG